MWTFAQNDPLLSVASTAVTDPLFGVARGTETCEGGDAAGELRREVAALYSARAAELLAYACLTAHDEELARDALQETFVRYFIARSGGEAIASPRAWLYRVLHNHLLDRLRESSYRQESGPKPLASMPDERQDVEAGLLLGEVLRVARGVLTRREFDCFSLRSQGWRYEEIASELRLRTSTVGVLISRAVGKIRRLVFHAPGGVA